MGKFQTGSYKPNVKKIARCHGGGCCSIECFDRFSRPIGLAAAENGYTFATVWGVCFTLIMIVMGVMYAYEKLFVQNLLSRYSMMHLRDPQGKFGRENGFNLAFALVDYAGDMSLDISSPSTVTL